MERLATQALGSARRAIETSHVPLTKMVLAGSVVRSPHSGSASFVSARNVLAVATLTILVGIQVFEDEGAGSVAAQKRRAKSQFLFEGAEEALARRVVPAVSFATHAAQGASAQPPESSFRRSSESSPT